MATVIARRSLSFARILRTTPRRPSPLFTLMTRCGATWVHLAQRPEKDLRVKDMEFRMGGRGRPGGANPDSLVPIIARRIGIEKHGDSFALFVSLEGEPMHQFGPPITLHFDGPFYVGIGFCSHLPATSDTAVLSDVVLENAAGKIQ